jgi:hypothetical protein
MPTPTTAPDPGDTEDAADDLSGGGDLADSGGPASLAWLLTGGLLLTCAGGALVWATRLGRD